MPRLTRTPDTIEKLFSAFASVAYGAMIDELAARPAAELRRALAALDPGRHVPSRMNNWTAAILLTEIAVEASGHDVVADSCNRPMIVRRSDASLAV